VTLANGVATITAAQVDNGSADNCGIASLQLSQTSFACANIGANTVLLTATDHSGNVASAPATVTVVGSAPAPTISTTSAGTYRGRRQNTFYLGYDSQPITLTATGGVSYVWSPARDLNNPYCANPVCTPTTPGIYTYTVTATNQYGCTATSSVTLEVVDVRCGNGKNQKVLVCHNGHEICISANAVDAHLNNPSHNDYLGSCSGTRLQAATAQTQVQAADPLEQVLEASPNPLSASTTIHFRPSETAAAQLQVYNQFGQLVATLFNEVAEGGRDYSREFRAADLPAGLYLCKFVSQGKVQLQRLTVVK